MFCSRAGQCVDTLIRTNSLTRRDQGKQDLMTFSELCRSWNKSDTICLLGINTQTFAVNCNSAVWDVLLCVSAHRHRVPFLGIQLSNVPSIGSLEHIGLGYDEGMESRTVMVPANGMVYKLREELKNAGALLFGLIFLAYLDIGGDYFCLLHPLFAFMCALYFCLVLAVMP